MSTEPTAVHDDHDSQPARPGASRMSTILILGTAVTLATAGQLLLKAGMTRVGSIDDLDLAQLPSLLTQVATTWQVPLGLVAFGASAAFWLVTLSRVPLSTAYPVVSLSYLLILGFSVIVLGERPGPIVWSGAVLIVGGISLIGVGQS